MPPKKPAAPRPLPAASRYRRGQAPAAAASESDSESESEADEVREAPKALDLSLFKEIRVGKDGMMEGVAQGHNVEESDEEESDASDEGKTEVPAHRVGETLSAESDSDDSSSGESSSSSDAPAPLYKPVFVSKRTTIEKVKQELDPEVQEAKRQEEAEQRRREAHELVAESIMKELAEKDVSETLDVDDTDGLDPEGEFEAWKLRELGRIKRDKEQEYAREREKAEVEARRALPEEIRLKEDLEHAEALKREKQEAKAREAPAFLQKYYHKGAFYQDMDILKKHNYMAPTVSTNTQIDSLPKIMQRRNYGKASQSKYTHLAAEDTSARGSSDPRGGFGRGGGRDKRMTSGDPREGPGRDGDRDRGYGRERDSGYGRERGHGYGRDRDSGYGNNRDSRSSEKAGDRYPERDKRYPAQSHERSHSRDAHSSRDSYRDRREDARYERKADLRYDSKRDARSRDLERDDRYTSSGSGR